MTDKEKINAIREEIVFLETVAFSEGVREYQSYKTKMVYEIARILELDLDEVRRKYKEKWGIK